MTNDDAPAAMGTGTYADVNGLHLYYETHGSGRPLILLHGGLGSGETFGPIIPIRAPADTSRSSPCRICRAPNDFQTSWRATRVTGAG